MDKVREYYLGKGFNCAESVLRAANDEYGLGIDEKALVMAGGFGGGMGCGSSCGALCGAIQALGAAKLTGRAADCPGFRDQCAGYCKAFEEALGSTMCRELGPMHKREDIRCFAVVERAYELLRQTMEEEANR